MLLVLTACITVRTGQDAWQAMNQQEKQYIETKLSKVKIGMTEQEVIDILGPNYYMKPMVLLWYPEFGSKSQVRAYFFKGKVFQVRWLIARDGFICYEIKHDDSK